MWRRRRRRHCFALAAALHTRARAWRNAQNAYVYTDPWRLGAHWEAESRLESNRSVSSCACDDDGDAGVWQSLKQDLMENLAVDPGFDGTWVHRLCRVAHPILFSSVRMDALGRLHMESGCLAGLLSMAVVCFQSVALQGQVESAWAWTDRVVLNEGESVGDLEGRLTFAECAQQCEEEPACASFAHGPSGCHLKNRCVDPHDELQPLGNHAQGYRTFFRQPCRSSGFLPPDEPSTSAPASLVFSTPDALGSNSTPSAIGASPRSVKLELIPPRTEELLTLVDIALQMAEGAAHCLRGSGWPFSVHELVENRLEFAQVPNGFRWVRHFATQGASTGLAAATLPVTPAGPQATGAAHGALSTAAAAGDDGAVYRALERCLLRWSRGMSSEVGFWHGLLAPAAKGEDAAAAREWLATGEVRWAWDDLCLYLANARQGSPTGLGPPRVLNAGSGPLAAGPLECGGVDQTNDDSMVEPVPVVSADGLARFYLQTFDELGQRPRRVPTQCPVEMLPSCFPRDYFDVTHMRNALDHAVDPLLGIRRMLDVTRPGGWVLLRHAQNEGVPGGFRVGLHQWAFDVAKEGPVPRFIAWGPSLHSDVTTWLLESGLASEVRTELRAHPGGPDAEGDYVWVDIRKPGRAVAISDTSA